jgi:hypothetical protein
MLGYKWIRIYMIVVLEDHSHTEKLTVCIEIDKGISETNSIKVISYKTQEKKYTLAVRTFSSLRASLEYLTNHLR